MAILTCVNRSNDAGEEIEAVAERGRELQPTVAEPVEGERDESLQPVSGGRQRVGEEEETAEQLSTETQTPSTVGADLEAPGEPLHTHYA